MRYYLRGIYDFFRYDIPQGIATVAYFFPVIWRFRRWDYGFQLAVIKRMLQNCDKHWSKSHYIGMEFTHGRIKVLLRMLDRYESYWDTPKPYNEDFHKQWRSHFAYEQHLLQRFLRHYSRTLPILWD